MTVCTDFTLHCTKICLGLVSDPPRYLVLPCSHSTESQTHVMDLRGKVGSTSARLGQHPLRCIIFLLIFNDHYEHYCPVCDHFSCLSDQCCQNCQNSACQTTACWTTACRTSDLHPINRLHHVGLVFNYPEKWPGLARRYTKQLILWLFINFIDDIVYLSGKICKINYSFIALNFKK